MIKSPFFETDRPTLQQIDIVDNLTDPMVVSAGAGTGKTWTLTKRYMNKLINGTMPEQIVAITFTKKAAQEMKGRIRHAIVEMEQHCSSEVEEKQWRKTRMNLDQAIISTIHGFCFELIKQYPLEAGIDPSSSILEENESQWLRQETVDSLIHELLDDSNANLLHLFEEWGSLHAVKSSIISLGELLHVHGWNIEEESHLIQVMQETEHNIEETSSAMIRRSQELFRAVEQAIGESQEIFQSKGKGIPDVYAAFYERWRAYSSYVENWTPFIGDPAFYMETIQSLKPSFGNTGGKELKPLRDMVKEAFEFWMTAGISDSYKQTVKALLAIGALFQKRYKEAKISRKTLDFSDLERIALKLSGDVNVQRDFQSNMKYVMLDENQDTNPLQMKLVTNLIGEGKETILFVVGDPKQSIYRFRGAEVSGFIQLKRKLKDQMLSHNFRTFSPIIDYINELFGSEKPEKKGIMRPVPGGPDYVVDYESGMQAARTGDDQCHIEWLMDCTEKEESDELLYPFNHEESPSARKEAANVAERIQQIVQSKVPIIEKERDGEKIKTAASYDDFAILFFTRTHQEKFEQELQKKHIPYQVIGGKFFWQQQEVRDVTNLLKLIVNPEDDISLAAYLRSPFGLLNDDTLVLLSLHDGLKTAFYQLNEQPQDMSRDQWDRLLHVRNELNQYRNDIRFDGSFKTVQKILQQSHFIPHLLCLPYGEQKVANVEKWLETVRALEEGQQLSPPQLVHYISMLAEEESHEQAEVVAGEGRGVTLMTVHASKGLEFPIVIVPKLQSGSGSGGSERLFYEPGKGIILHYSGEESKLIDGLYIHSYKEENTRREVEESKRLLYVALTRARDYLILSSLKGRAKKPAPEKEDSTIYWLLRHLNPDMLCYSDAYDHYQSLLQPGETAATVTVDGIKMKLFTSFNVNGDHDNVAAAQLQEQLELPAWHEESSHNNKNKRFSTYSFSMLNEFKSCERKFYFKRVEGIPDFLEESIITHTDEWDVRNEEVAAASDMEYEGTMLSGALLGSIVHRGCELMAKGFSKTVAAEMALQHYGKKTAGATEMILPYLNNYERSDYLAASSQSEVQFQINVNGRIVVGIIDLLIDHNDGTCSIVDFKTNKLFGTKSIDDLVDTYEQQMLLYAWAAQSIAGLKVKEAVLLFLDSDVNRTVSLDLTKVSNSVAQVEAMIERMESKAGIDNFAKNEGTQCTFCPYQSICGLYQ